VFPYKSFQRFSCQAELDIVDLGHPGTDCASQRFPEAMVGNFQKLLADDLPPFVGWRFGHELALHPEAAFVQWHAMFAVFPLHITTPDFLKSKAFETSRDG
jgi:hypothetical protein